MTDLIHRSTVDLSLDKAEFCGLKSQVNGLPQPSVGGKTAKARHYRAFNLKASADEVIE
jgi:hypothetical protein